MTLEPMTIVLALVALAGLVIVVIAAPGVIRQRRRDLLERKMGQMGVTFEDVAAAMRTVALAMTGIGVAVVAAAESMRAFGEALQAQNQLLAAYDELSRPRTILIASERARGEAYAREHGINAVAILTPRSRDRARGIIADEYMLMPSMVDHPATEELIDAAMPSLLTSERW